MHVHGSVPFLVSALVIASMAYLYKGAYYSDGSNAQGGPVYSKDKVAFSTSRLGTQVGSYGGTGKQTLIPALWRYVRGA